MRLLPEMANHIAAPTPQGADVTSWHYFRDLQRIDSSGKQLSIWTDLNADTHPRDGVPVARNARRVILR
jgi:hypothetical protein